MAKGGLFVPRSDAARVRRRRLTDAVNRLDVAIRAGLVTPTRDELRALATMCKEQGLVDEAFRVLRWLWHVSDV